jgi:hypothetical protein
MNRKLGVVFGSIRFLVVDCGLEEFTLLFGTTDPHVKVFGNQDDRVGQFVSKQPLMQDDASQIRFVVIQTTPMQTQAFGASPKVAAAEKVRNETNRNE